jgi:perosamine synthetase
MKSLKKIPRGIIYHSVIQSISYFARATWAPLNDFIKVNEFEATFAQYCGRKYCIAFPFARTAIYFILKSLNLPKGSEVLLPPITIKGIVDVVVDLGLTPKYIDVDMETVGFNIDELTKKITPFTRVALITPLFGLVPNMHAICAILHQHGVFIIEDFSQCLNGEFNGQRIGTFGDAAVYSASSIKTLDTLGGGFAITDDVELNVKLKLEQSKLASPSRAFLVKKAWINCVRNVATVNPIFTLFTFPLLQLLRKINPSAALKQTGGRDKNRLEKLPAVWFTSYSSLQAEIGLVKIKEVQRMDKHRISNVDRIKSAVPAVHFPLTTSLSRNVYWQLIFHADDAAHIQSVFASRGIDVATSSLELVCELEDYPSSEKLVNAERIYKNGVFIPCYPNLTDGDVNRVIAALSSIDLK